MERFVFLGISFPCLTIMIYGAYGILACLGHYKTSKAIDTIRMLVD